MKTKLQNLYSQSGLPMIGKKEFRPFRVNTIFSLIADVAWVSGAKKIGQPDKIDRSSRLVACKGLITNDLGMDLAYLINY